MLIKGLLASQTMYMCLLWMLKEDINVLYGIRQFKAVEIAPWPLGQWNELQSQHRADMKEY